MKIIFVLFVLGLAVAEEPNAVPKGILVVQGKPAEMGMFPWQALVRGTTINNARFTCGGSLITTRWVLTAAHCTEAKSYEIVLGTLRSRPPYGNESIVIKTDTAVVHDTYNSKWNKNDIAVIDLKQNVNLSDYIQTINLDTKGTGGGVRVNVSGWGRISDDSYTSLTLNYGRVTTITNNECKKKYPFGLTDGSLCCVGVPLNACDGDSGSPLVKYDKDKPVQVGIVSFMLGSCSSGMPVVYTRIQFHIGWIRTATK